MKAAGDTKRRFSEKKGIIGPQDWYLMDYNNETKNYFKSKDPQIQKMTQPLLIEENTPLRADDHLDGVLEKRVDEEAPETAALIE